MKLTKDTQNGFNLWVVEHTTTDGAKIRTMYQVTGKEMELATDATRAMVAQELWRMRRDCRAMAEAGPPD